MKKPEIDKYLATVKEHKEVEVNLSCLTKHEIASYLYNWYLPSVEHVFVDKEAGLFCAKQLYEVFPNAVHICSTNEKLTLVTFGGKEYFWENEDYEEDDNPKINLLKLVLYLRGFTIGVLVEYSLRVEINWLPLTILILILTISVFDIIDKK